MGQVGEQLQIPLEAPALLRMAQVKIQPDRLSQTSFRLSQILRFYMLDFCVPGPFPTSCKAVYPGLSELFWRISCHNVCKPKGKDSTPVSSVDTQLWTEIWGDELYQQRAHMAPLFSDTTLHPHHTDPQPRTSRTTHKRSRHALSCPAYTPTISLLPSSIAQGSAHSCLVVVRGEGALIVTN